MTCLWPRIEPLLPRVQKPARYIGCEDGMVPGSAGPAQVGWLLIYPDTYEIGLPNQGLQILYEILNERDDAWAERSYAPWVDMEAEMRRRGVPLFSVDGHRPAAEFDLLAFNVSAELVYTNLVNCIDMAGTAVRAAERDETDPLVAAGGLAGAVYANPASPVHLAAGLLLAEEAGAIVTDQHASSWQLQSPVFIVAASDSLHRDLVPLVRATLDDLL